jgi:hypothetical protein
MASVLVGALGLMSVAAPSVFAEPAPGCTVTTVTPPTDFLIYIDGSGSMCPYITQITSRLGTFVQGLSSKNYTDARFAVATFGGLPELVVPFTTNTTTVANVLSTIGCSRGGKKPVLKPYVSLLLLTRALTSRNRVGPVTVQNNVNSSGETALLLVNLSSC